MVARGDQQILQFMQVEIETKKRYLENIIEDPTTQSSMEEESKG